MVDAAKKSGRVIQIGFQRRQSSAVKAAKQFIQEESLGKVVQVDAQIHYTAGIRDTTPQKPPASLDWDLWCGPGPKIPYCPQVGHFAWRLEAAYGNGHLVDWGIHLIDATRVILGESVPHHIQSAGGIYYLKDKITTPDTLTAHFDFNRCPVTWRHRLWGAVEYNPEVNNGIFFFCEKGTVFVTDRQWIIIPGGKEAEKKVMPAEGKEDMAALHMADFLKAVQTRENPCCTIEDAFQSTSTVQLGMIAYHAGEKIAYDAQKEQILGNPLAAKLLKREYRAPYTHPYREG